MKNYLLLVLTLCTFTVTAQNIEYDGGAKRSVMNCTAAIRVGMTNYLSKEKPYNFLPYVDTLSIVLYKNPVMIDKPLQYMAKLTLQSYFIETKDSRVDYEDIRQILTDIGTLRSFHNIYFNICAQGLAEHYEQAGNFTDAVTFYKLAIKSVKDYTKGVPTDYEWMLNKKVELIYLKNLSEYNKATTYSANALTLRSQLSGKDSEAYYDELSSYATSCSLARLDLKADSLYNIYQQHLISTNAPQEDIAEVLINRAEIYGNMKQTSKAIDFYCQALTKSTNDTIKINLLYNLATTYYGEGNDAKCVESINNALDIYEKNKFDDSSMLLQLARICLSSNSGPQKQRISRLYAKATHTDDIQGVSEQAFMDLLVGKFDVGMGLLDKAKALADGKIANGTIDATELDAISMPLSKACDFKTEAEYQTKYLKLLQKQYGNDSPLVLDVYNVLAGTYMLAGDIKAATNVVEEGLKSANTQSNQYASLMSTKADCMVSKGDYMGAISIYKNLLKSKSGPLAVWQTYSSIYGCYISECDLRKSNKDSRQSYAVLKDSLWLYCQKMLNLANNELGIGSEYHIESLLAVASYYLITDDMTQMKSTAMQCEKLIKQYVSNPQTRKTLLESLATYFYMSHDYHKVLDLMNENDITTKQPEETDIYNYLVLSETYLNLNNISKAQYYYKKQSDFISQRVEKNFLILTDKDRNLYWNVFKQQIYDAGKYADTYGKESPFAGTIYNLALFAKGLLLNSSRSFTQLINDSGNASLKEQMQKMQQLRMSANSKEDISAEVKYSYLAEADRIEQNLLTSSSEYGNYLNYLKCDWKQLQKSLQSTDIAIEFIIYYDNKSIGHYAAVLLRKDYAYPIFVNLYDKDTFEQQVKDLAMTDVNGKTVWEPLSKYIQGITNIYFSPTGILNKLAIEYLPFEGSDLISDKYNVYRLSSTRLIAQQTQPRRIQSATIFGGFEYDTDVKTLSSQHAANTQNDKPDRWEYALGKTRMGVNYLEGTKMEADTISNMLGNNKIQVTVLTGTKGTEESFKALSGQNINLIHIGTHGFYAAIDSSITSVRSIKNMILNSPAEDKSMLESGLLFAGVNNILRKATLPSYIDDGILTAQEISLTDLHQTDLVTLSACVTAEGDVRGDGVFGIQRGFKLAGVNSIIMSSWPVNDASTMLLMKLFYGNLMSGMSKQQSLLKAIKQVKQTYSNYKDWAPFILLDAIK